MSISGFIKQQLRPFLNVDRNVDEQFVIASAPVSFRPVIAPANRVRTEEPVRRDAFKERPK